MLTLSESQLAQFGGASEALLLRAMLAHLRRHHALAVAEIATPELTARVRRGLTAARALGFSTQRQLGVFLGLACEYGEGFWTHPAVAEALDHPDPDRLAKLPVRVHRRVWAELLTLRQAGTGDVRPGFDDAA